MQAWRQAGMNSVLLLDTIDTLKNRDAAAAGRREGGGCASRAMAMVVATAGSSTTWASLSSTAWAKLALPVPKSRPRSTAAVAWRRCLEQNKTTHRPQTQTADSHATHQPSWHDAWRVDASPATSQACIAGMQKRGLGAHPLLMSSSTACPTLSMPHALERRATCPVAPLVDIGGHWEHD